MGATRFSGPVYGAKATLAHVRVADMSSGAGDGVSTAVFRMTVPNYEEWYATEWAISRESTGSTGFFANILKGSTVVSSASITSSLAAQSTTKTITATAGEYEGYQLASGKVVTFVVGASSVNPASSGIGLTLRGFTRFVSSSNRSE